MSAPVTLEVRPERRRERGRGGGSRGGGGGSGDKNSQASGGGGSLGGGTPAMKLKIVMRKLPPLMTETELREHTSEWIDYENLNFFRFVDGKVHDEYVVFLVHPEIFLTRK